jgi:hypothetical protein
MSATPVLCKPHAHTEYKLSHLISQGRSQTKPTTVQVASLSKRRLLVGSEPAVGADRPPVGVYRRGRGGRVAGESEDEPRCAVVLELVVVRGHGADDGSERPVLAPPCAHGDVTQRAAGGPVAVAVLAEVARLVDVVVVEVAELGVPAAAARAGERRRRRRRGRRARLRRVLLPRARVPCRFALPALGHPAAAELLLLLELVRFPLDRGLVRHVRFGPLPHERGPQRRRLLLRGGRGALRDDLTEELEPAGRGGHLHVRQHPEKRS